MSDGEPIRELLMVPATLPRFIRLPGEAARYVAIETADPPPDRQRSSRATSCSAAAPSGSSATATSRSRRRPRIWSAIFRSAIKRRRRGRVIRLKLEADMPDELEALVREGLDAQRGPGLRIDRLPRHRRPRRCWSRRTGPTSNSRPSRRASPSGSANMAAIASPRSAPRTSSSTTPMRASTSSSPSSARRPRIRTWSRSSRRSTAPASSRR